MYYIILLLSLLRDSTNYSMIIMQTLSWELQVLAYSPHVLCYKKVVSPCTGIALGLV